MSVQSNSREVISLYLQHIRKYPHLAIGAILSVPLTTLINNFLPPLILAGVIQRLSTGDYTQNNVIGSFGPQIIMYSALMLIGIAGWRLVDYFVWRLEAKVSKDLAHTIYQHLLNLSADFHANNFGGSLVSQSNKLISSYVKIADTTIYGTMPMIWGLIFASIILINRAPMFVFAMNLIVILFLYVAILITRSTREASSTYATAESDQTGALADSITNVLAIKSFSGSKFENSRFATFTNNTQQKLLKLMKKLVIQITSFTLFTRVLQIVAFIIAVISIVNFGANIATVFLVLNYSSLIADQLFNFCQGALRNYNRSFGDASDMTRILGLHPKVLDPIKPKPVASANGSIEFNQVHFRHDGNKDKLFTDFNLSFKPGEKVGLVGHSGSGKTTLTKLLLRFNDIDSGEICVDGQNIKVITQDDLHNKITYVPQEPLLFHRTLSENIAYGKPSATQSEIEHVSKLAHAHEFVKDLPKGYKTLVGERGVKLSGGQRQRVAIARAMIKDAPILVLDEATSALDSESEVLIQDALWRLMEGKTAIVIAHRLSTIQKMDRIVVLEEGNILEQGSHDQLLKAKGKYAELWAHQSGGFIED